MSYSVRPSDEVLQQINRRGLSGHVIREILRGLDELSVNPSRHLVRVGPPADELQYDLIISEPVDPAGEYLITFAVVYATDEETLRLTRCDITFEPRPRSLSTVVADEFTCYFRHLASRVERALRALPQEKLWQKPFSFGNSVGHLVLHLTGNLNHYVGAKIAGTGYVRDRPREFTDPTEYPGDELLKRFHDAVGLVVRTVQSLDAEGLMAPVAEEQPIETRFGLLLVCAAHLNNHIGQMSYLVQALGHSTQEPPIW